MTQPLAEAVAVLNACQHRGARNWYFDAEQRRIMPYQWDAPEFPPVFTPWEAVTLARGLVAIGAVREHVG